MAHKFDPKNMSRLDDPKRKELLPPDEILGKLGLKKGDTFLDIGAGTGYFTFPASVITGETGKVIAVDVSEEMADELSNRVLSSGVPNVEVKQVQENETGAVPGTIDIALLCNVLHEAEDRLQTLASVRGSLKPGGRIGIVEWKKAVTPMGPPLSERISEVELKSLLDRAGFCAIRSEEIHGTYLLLSAAAPV